MGAEANGYLIGYLLQKHNEREEMVQRFCEMVDCEELRFEIVCFYETHRADYRNAMRQVKHNTQASAKVSKQTKLPKAAARALKDAMNSDLTMVVRLFQPFPQI